MFGQPSQPISDKGRGAGCHLGRSPSHQHPIPSELHGQATSAMRTASAHWETAFFFFSKLSGVGGGVVDFVDNA